MTHSQITSLLIGQNKHDLNIHPSEVKYLTNNNVAYLFSIRAKQPGIVEKQLLVRGQQFQGKFEKTLLELMGLTKRTQINPIIIKTIKWSGEVVDGDIDLVIQPEDLSEFIQIMQDAGFLIVKESEHQVICTKPGLCKVEPRTRIEYSGKYFADYDDVKKYAHQETLGKYKFLTTSPRYDNLLITMNILYGPKYLRLYDYLQITQFGFPETQNCPQPFQDDVKFINAFLGKVSPSKPFPVFVPLLDYVFWWTHRVLGHHSIAMWLQLKMICFYLYSRLRYSFTGNLVHTHDWT